MFLPSLGPACSCWDLTQDISLVTGEKIWVASRETSAALQWQGFCSPFQQSVSLHYGSVASLSKRWDLKICWAKFFRDPTLIPPFTFQGPSFANWDPGLKRSTLLGHFYVSKALELYQCSFCSAVLAFPVQEVKMSLSYQRISLISQLSPNYWLMTSVSDQNHLAIISQLC